MDDKWVVITVFCIIAFSLGFICGIAFGGVNKKNKSLKEDKAIKDTNKGIKTKNRQGNISAEVVDSISTHANYMQQSKDRDDEDKPHLSKKQLRKKQKREEKERKRKDEQKLKEKTIIELKKNKFDPRVSKPESFEYTDLSISDGQLTVCTLGKTSYYHCWAYEGKLYYEFYCDSIKVAKAINNHSAIIDPFCVKHKDSVSLDVAKSLDVIEYGELTSEYKIINKTTVKFK